VILAENQPVRRLGATELEVHRLCLGGNVFGWTVDERASFGILDAYRHAGGNWVDTADVYQRWVPGHTGFESETVIGNWLASRGCRDDMLIATKVGGPAKESARAALFEPNGTPRLEGSLRDLSTRVDGCLTRLKTDRIDLLYAHLDDYSRPVDEYLLEFNGLVTAGKVRYIAAANFEPDRLKAALAASERLGLARFAAIQMRYNLLERSDFEGSMATVVQDNGLGFVPYWALAKGFLTGKYGVVGAAASLSERAEMLKVGTYADHPRAAAVLAALTKIARSRGASLSAIAIAWLLAQPAVTAPAVSARTREQLAEIMSACSLPLTPDEIAALDVASQEAGSLASVTEPGK
jgi:aryl-alcohol dehydrogenase-like predicted oxidoreductase